MAQNAETRGMIAANYDQQADILTFAFTEKPQAAVAEEAADEVWVRYAPDTHRVVSVDVLNFSARVRAAFGPQLVYTERNDPQRLEGLHGLAMLAGSEKAT